MLQDEALLATQEKFRADRDTLMLATDKRMLVDNYNKLTVPQQGEIATYRQALLDSTIDWVIPTKLSWLP